MLEFTRLGDTITSQGNTLSKNLRDFDCEQCRFYDWKRTTAADGIVKTTRRSLRSPTRAAQNVFICRASGSDFSNHLGFPG